MTCTENKLTSCELQPIYDNRKSFYGKAKIIHDYESGNISLMSYNTVVCRIDNYNKFHRIWNDYSATTMRHINEFIKQYGISGGGKKWWDSLPIES